MTVHAPYNFVPLSRKVVFLEESEYISHDVPYSDGLSGTLRVKLTTVTPTIVGDREDPDEVKQPFSLNEEWAIPGTSIRGMLRNVVEIASFSRMQFVDRSRRYAVRDFHANFYKQEMAGRRSDGSFEPRVKTGWLRLEDGKYTIKECKVSRVEHSDLVSHWPQTRAIFDGPQTRKAPANERYAALERIEPPLNPIQFTPEQPQIHGRSKMYFSKATDIGTGKTKGILVLTGHPGGNKHREFIFHECGQVHSVPASVFDDFEFNHQEDQGENKTGRERPNDEWGYMRGRLTEPQGVPVFFKRSGTGVTSIGLSQAYRLAYKNSIGQAIDVTSVDHDAEYEDARLDIAEALFGHARKVDDGALKGRVAVGLFRESTEHRESAEIFHGVLNGPKPTYYPSYMKQDVGKNGALRKGDYKTFMNDDGEVRGWKRYPVRSKHVTPRATQDQKNVSSKWRAVPEGVEFEGEIRFHNLRPFELGALVWSLDFGGEEGGLCHSLGGGKPFGFGGVRLASTSAEITSNSGDEVSGTDALAAFKALMEDKTEEWKESSQLRELLGMADPRRGDQNADELTYMTLGDGPRNNAFTKAKNQRDAPGQEALMPYVGSGEGAAGEYNREAKLYPDLGGVRVLEDRERVRKAVQKAAEEKAEEEGRLALSPEERFRELFSTEVSADAQTQLSWIKQTMQKGGHSQWLGSLAELKVGIKACLTDAMKKMGGSSGAGNDDAVRLAQPKAGLEKHEEKRPHREDRAAIRKWRKKKKNLEKQIELAKTSLNKRTEQSNKYVDVLNWLDDQSGVISDEDDCEEGADS